jgi:hypothetical protein
MMNVFSRAAAGLTMVLAVTVSTGCMENIALVGRPTLQLDQDEASPGARMQTLDGRVEQLDFQRRYFQIRDQSRELVIVSLSSNAERLDVDRFRALRDGDYVRVEGRFLDRQWFELATFLRDNR